MNVYDFDGTIYDGDSTVDFLIYMYRKHPGLMIPQAARPVSGGSAL